MENISFKIGCLTTLILLASSCYSYKKLMKDGEGAEDDAIENVIVDYYHNNKQEIKNYDVFVLELKRDNNFLYNILVDYQQNKEILKSEDKIGTYSNSFPTMYKIYNSKLFIWNDSKTPINQETLNILYKYNKLDSTYIKLDLALIDSNNYDPPMFRIDENAKTVYYIICKNDISKYKKLKTSVYISPGSDKLPKVNCD